jgi:DNA-binding beta-propeller fold protein YncE
LALALGACAQGPALIERAAEPGAVDFDARALLALSDADMAGTAYADGRLAPLAGVTDTLSVIAPANLGEAVAGAPVSNSVMAWPGAMALSADGRFAYVVETRAPAPAGVAVMEEGVDAGMPIGRLLTAIDVSDPANPRMIGTIDVGAQPTSVHVSPDGRFALVSRRVAEAPIVAVLLESGAPVDVIELALRVPEAARSAADPGAQFVRIAPNGRDVAINFGNTHVHFARLSVDETGAPLGLGAIGAPVRVGQWITVLRWANDGRYLIVSDVAWGPGRLDTVLNGPGQLVSIAFDPNGRHRIVSSAEVSLSPEGFEMNAQGDLIVAVNMERTYLPERLPYTLFGRRARASLSLVGFDPGAGTLTNVDGPLAFDGVLPEDAAFDDDGDVIAVAVFNERSQAPQQGWVAYFRVVRDGDAVRLAPTDTRTSLPRGVHDLEVVRGGG